MKYGSGFSLAQRAFCCLLFLTNVATFLAQTAQVSAKPTPDISAKRIFLTGNNNVSFGSAPTISAKLSELSVSFWIKSSTPSDSFLFSMGRSAADYDGEFIIRTDRAGLLWVWEFSHETELGSFVASKSSVLTGEYVHLAVVKNGANTSIFVNGQLEASITANSVVHIMNNNITIGCDIRDNDMCLNGEINSFSFFSSTLNPADVVAAFLVPPIVSPQLSQFAAPQPLTDSVKLGTMPTVTQNVLLVSKAVTPNDPTCAGLYIVKDWLNGKPVYVNDAKSRWIGWNGKAWVIAGMSSYSDFLASQVLGFGGYHLSTNGDVPLAITAVWSQYEVSAVFRSFAIDVIPNASNYATCDGEYVPRGMLNNRPVFVCDARSRWIGWNGYRWALTSTSYYSEFLANQATGFGAFHFSLNGDVSIYDTTWKAYTLRII